MRSPSSSDHRRVIRWAVLRWTAPHVKKLVEDLLHVRLGDRPQAFRTLLHVLAPVDSPVTLVDARRAGIRLRGRGESIHERRHLDLGAWAFALVPRLALASPVEGVPLAVGV